MLNVEILGDREEGEGLSVQCLIVFWYVGM